MKKVNYSRILRRKRRVSENVFGTGEIPRLVVFRSNRYTYVQAIDDRSRKTIVSYSSLVLSKGKEYRKMKKTEEAREAGKQFAKMLLDKKIKKGVFDRSLYAYKGRVKTLAEGLREGGLDI